MNGLPGCEFACGCADLGARQREERAGQHLQSQCEEWARQLLCDSYISRWLEGVSAFSLSPWWHLVGPEPNPAAGGGKEAETAAVFGGHVQAAAAQTLAA